MVLTISHTTQRRFILGQQGLFPGRRWQGIDGVADAINAGCVVQVDPLNVVARNHDLVLHSRVNDYRPADLDQLLYKNHAFFDWGGTVMIRPMGELPYWRVIMQRKQREPRRVRFAREFADTIAAVLNVIRDSGPQSARDFKSSARQINGFRSAKDTSQALYYLWLAGEVMTHSRRGFERVYDLRERVAPEDSQWVASENEADLYFERSPFHRMGLITGRSWRAWYSSIIERKVSPAEADAHLARLLKADAITPVSITHDPKTIYYVLAEDVPHLEILNLGATPTKWHPLGSSTAAEMVFLGPLDIVSARGRATELFDFEYLWEVYKPQEKRRWGYYTLPILYGDRLVARLDPRLDRNTRTLTINGFWIEPTSTPDDSFVAALAAGLRRFMRFLGADHIDLTAIAAPLKASLADRLQFA